MDSYGISSLGDALNYAGGIAALVASIALVVVVGERVSISWGRAACKRRHPATIGRNARLVRERRAKLNRRATGSDA